MASISNINLRKQVRDYFFFNSKTYTKEDLEAKQARCGELFDDLQDCVRRHGWNDNMCQLVSKPKYERCVVKRDKI